MKEEILDNRLILKFLSTMAFCISFFVATTSYAEEAANEYTIFVGQTLTFNAKEVTKVSVGLTNVASVTKTNDEKQLILTGKQLGNTTLTLYSGSDKKIILIRVVSTDPNMLAEEAEQLLGKRSGVTIRIVKGRVLLEGEVAGEVYKKKIENLVKLYPDQVLNFTTYREAFVEGARMVAFDIHFVQLSDNGNDNLGIKWGQFIGSNLTYSKSNSSFYTNKDPRIGNGIMPGESNPLRIPNVVNLLNGKAAWSIVGNLSAAIDFLAAYGHIKEIKHSTIVTEGGTEAEYRNGGTLLVKVSGVNSGQLIEKPYGLMMTLKPVIDIDDRVKVRIKLDISELDHGNSVDGVPALRNSLVDATVNMQEGQSVLIATQQSILDSTHKEGFAYLAKIPIVGFLFGSRGKVHTEVNNAIFITPHIYEPGKDYGKTLVDGVFDRLEDAGFDKKELPKMSKPTPKVNQPRYTHNIPWSNNEKEPAPEK